MPIARLEALILSSLGVVVVALQTEVLADARVFGAVPDLVAVSVVGVAVRLGPVPAALYGFGVGLGVDAYSTLPFGLGALSCAAVGYGVALGYSGFLRSSPWIPVALGGVGAAARSAAFAVGAVLVGQDWLLQARTLRVVVVTGVLGVPLATVVLPVVTSALRPVVHGERLR